MSDFFLYVYLLFFAAGLVALLLLLFSFNREDSGPDNADAG